jgi:hypothetical protein
MLLPDDDVSRSLVSAYATVRASFREDIGERPLVLANSEFFPDAFRGDQEGVQALVRRMQAHAGMLDVPVHAKLTEAPAQTASGCGDSCAPERSFDEARLVDEGDAWRLRLAPAELRHPVGLTTLVARSLSQVFLVETRRPDFRAQIPPEILVDLLAVNLGFGALLMEGAYVYAKSCGGPSVVKLTALGLPELGLVTALSCALWPKSLGAARKVASTTQAATLATAEAWLRGNRELALQVQRAPELVERGAFRLSPPRERLFPWFGSRSKQNPADEFPALTATTPTSARRPAPDDGLKELVEEVLGTR